MPLIDLNAIACLNHSERDAIREHCRLSGSIVRILAIRTFLIEEIHEKRARLKMKFFKLHCPELEILYRKILFGGKACVTSFHTFPCSFRNHLDSILYQQVNRDAFGKLGFRLASVYYNTHSMNVEEMHTAKEFIISEWELTDDTSNDRLILLKFRDEFIELMQRLTEIAKANGSPREAVKKLQKETNRYKNITSSV